jgi:hypothetical protein
MAAKEEHIKCDLKRLQETLTNTTTKDEAKPFCDTLLKKYNSKIIWIKGKAALISEENSEKDGVGQRLIPDDIYVETNENKNPGFFACKASGNGDCLFNAASRILVGDESLCHLRLLTSI